MAGFNYFTRFAVVSWGNGLIIWFKRTWPCFSRCRLLLHRCLSLSFAYPKVGLPFVNGNDPNLKFLLMIPSGLVGHVRARPPCFQLVNLPQRRQSADPFAISFPLQGLWQCWREPSWRHLWLTSASRWAAHQLAPTAPTFQWNSSTSLHVDWQVQAGVAQNAGEAIQKLG